MPTRLLVLADTHLPKRAKALPGAVLEALDASAGVIHAGDWVDEATLDLLQDRSPLVIGVAGNNDGPGLHARLPEVARAEVDGVRLGVVHETGPATGREARMAVAFPDVDLLVFGHSHIPWDTSAPSGLRLLNPGSPTDRRRQPRCTYGVLTLDAGSVSWELLAV
ncbi:metallophosphoesterase [Jatrophihabitans endophyticus]|uniref:metallophosphoesterase family protein n=1 Tax=Jatrophihabitans endophyticus TaxID=1206085 RepID=UPI0019F749C6|nr:metallophosphoesterase [Jatrophihabitans endophyticus]MBE7190715.1 metallophosphoesterase [Jatrophihabitans endophyticus]